MGLKMGKMYNRPKGKEVANARSVDYHDGLIERLKNHDYAVAYLNAALKESAKGDEESQKIFLMALRDIAEAQ